MDLEKAARSTEQPAKTPPGPKPRRWARHKWFPTLLLVATATWWVRQAAYANYHTVFHVLVILLNVVLISSWYLICGNAPKRVRRCTAYGIWLALVAYFVLLRPVYNGDMGVFKWRLRFARDADESLAPLTPTGQITDWQTTSRDYPRFLGNAYWAEVHGVALETDWRARPPREIWRREIGAGWSAFAVVGNYAFTQEQRGENELVTCYRVDTGQPVWTHADTTRFDPANVAASPGGIGPRATPTIHDAKVITQGATGVVNCLDARTGRVLWSHDTPVEFGSPVALWGKSGSPLVVDDMVIISVGCSDPAGEPAGEPALAGGTGGTKSSHNSSLVAFDIETGEIRWTAGNRPASYASPVLANLAGERQIIVVNLGFVTSHRPIDGAVLWEHPWKDPSDTTASCSQPVPLPGDRLFLSKGYGVGASLLEIKRDAAGKLLAEPLWTPPVQRVMKTKLCNIVFRDGYVYGLDDVLLECIELETGKVQWKKRRNPEFGHGQIMLIGAAILVLSETGELALVEASPDRYHELASIHALDDSNITWNNPAFAPPYLLVRNNRQAACFRLPLKEKELLAN